MINTYDWQLLTESERRELLTRPAVLEDDTVKETARSIIARVRRDGDRALAELAQEIDGRLATQLRVAPEEFREANASLSSEQKSAIAMAARNIEAFHSAQQTQPVDIETVPGVRCERVTRPLRSVGLYVPAGSAPLPSTVLMLGVPAKIAGCPVRIVCSPPRSDGKIDPAVLYAAEIVHASCVFKVGGAQAIAALAYGTETIPRVDKVFGPGNAWVTAAKSLVSQDPSGAARDMPAGPSEVLVIADESAEPAFVASDLLSQAEHGADSQVILVTDSPPLAEQVAREIGTQCRRLSRNSIVAGALRHSFSLLVDSIESAVDVANRYAPEHLILQVENPRQWLPRIYAAGSIFVGPWTPESIGDYCSGTNHVLPTYGFARSYSSLGLSDFMRAMTIQELTPGGLLEIGPTAEILASLEGLDAHAYAVTNRLARLRAKDMP